jgi:8-oxo-dGTP pyrophosphatase MutT (NUDIX family)
MPSEGQGPGPEAAAAGGPAGQELVEVLDDGGRPIGRTTRWVAHATGARHPTVHVWVMRPGRRGPTVVLQWRRDDREDFPDLLDVTAGGHVQAGETVDAAMRRELGEELGLRSVRVAPLGARAVDAVTHGRLIREWAHEYLHVTRRRLTAFRPDPGEVKGLVEAPLAELAALHAGARDRIMVTGTLVTAGDGRPVSRPVDRAAFVPAPDDAWLRLWERLEAAYTAWPPGS